MAAGAKVGAAREVVGVEAGSLAGAAGVWGGAAAASVWEVEAGWEAREGWAAGGAVVGRQSPPPM